MRRQKERKTWSLKNAETKRKKDVVFKECGDKKNAETKRMRKQKECGDVSKKMRRRL